MSIFSQRFKELRKKNNMTQAQLAEALYTSPQNISRWENSESSPDFDMLLDIAKLFTVSTDYLLGRDDNNERVILSDIFRFVKNLPKEQQLATVKNMCDKAVMAMFASVFERNEDQYNYESACVSVNTDYGFSLNSYGETEDEKRMPMFLIFSESDKKLANDYIKPNPKYKGLFEALADEDTFNAILKIYGLHAAGYKHDYGFDAASLEKELDLNGEIFEKVLDNLEKYGFFYSREINAKTKIYHLRPNMPLMCIIYLSYFFLFNRINGNI